MRLWTVVTAVLVVSVGTNVALRAECIAVSPADAKRGAKLVFEGTVTKVEALNHPEYAATLTVDRVWKGTVPKDITVYYAGSIDGPALKEGDRRILFAVRQTPAMRKASGLSSDSPSRDVWVPPCSGAWSADSAVLMQLGPGRQPKGKH